MWQRQVLCGRVQGGGFMSYGDLQPGHQGELARVLNFSKKYSFSAFKGKDLFS